MTMVDNVTNGTLAPDELLESNWKRQSDSHCSTVFLLGSRVQVYMRKGTLIVEAVIELLSPDSL